MKKTDLSVKLLQSLNTVNLQLKKICEETNGLITYTFSEDKLICFKYKDYDSKFKFEIVDLNLSPNSTPVFKIAHIPASSTSVAALRSEKNNKDILNFFQTWIGWIKVYEKSDLTDEDKILKQYEEEFYTEFEILDEDANTTPYSLDQQLQIDQYLEKVQLKLEQSNLTDEIKKEITTDVAELRADLGRSTKTTVVKKMSSIFAKIRKASVSVLKDFYDIGKKEVYKRMLSGGIEEAGQLIDLL